MALSLRGGVAVSLLLAGLAIFFLAPVIPVQVQASIPDHSVSGYNCGFIINYTTTEFRSPSYHIFGVGYRYRELSSLKGYCEKQLLTSQRLLSGYEKRAGWYSPSSLSEPINPSRQRNPLCNS